jgi:hypothetical protein
MINLGEALQSIAYTEHCLPNDQHRRTTVGKIPTTGRANRSWSSSEEPVSGNVQRRAG